MREKKELGNLSLLGNQKTKYSYEHPNKNILETFDNKHPDLDYIVSFKCPEFTSLCPKTGQPDFATINIQYIPNKKMVESKSLKLYLFAYRNHGDFHEDCTVQIMKDLRDIMEPKWIRVIGDFTPRGGISICPIAEWKQEGYIPPIITNNYKTHMRHL